MMAVTAATGGAAGAWGEGVASGLGAGKTTAQIIGGAVGGGVAGVSGQFTGDVYDQALMGKEGFSDLGSYGMAGLTGAASGAAMGAFMSRIQAAGSKYLAPSMKTMSQVYAERYPGLDNALTRMRSAGAREGLVLRVSAQELEQLTEAGLVNRANWSESWQRVKAVAGNERIDVHSRPLAKVHPQSEIERFYGDVDPASGQVNVRNPKPTSGGYVADAEDLAVCSPSTDQSVRESFGIDNPDYRWYEKYHTDNDPLFEVTFNVTAELDVPLPQTEAPGTPLGTMNPENHHMAGVGKTKGGVPEGVLPKGTPIHIVDIRPVGTPRASYPATGQPYDPFPASPPQVRHLPTAVSGATAGPSAIAAGRDVTAGDEVKKQRNE